MKGDATVPRGQPPSASTSRFLARLEANQGTGWVRTATQGEPRTIAFSEFQQVVRRYPPSQLLPALADLAAARAMQGGGIESMLGSPPWAIATIARESILRGNDYRRASVDDHALVAVFNAHNNIDEDLSQDSIAPFLVRMSYEQFPYQESDYEEVCRSHAMLVEGAAEIPTEVLGERAWIDVFGAPLDHVVGATFFLHAAASLHAGWVYPSWFDRDDLQPLYDVWPKTVIEHRLDGLTSTFDEFKAAYKAAHDEVGELPPGFERYAYNPLVRRPFVRMPGGGILAPQPRLILRTVSPGSLYYAAISKLDQPFGRDLGDLTQHYVGKQLKSIDPNVVVHPEITYYVGKQEMRSVDWFIDLPSVLVMVEVKSARFGLLERAGFGGYEDNVRRLLGKAAAQLQRSADAIDQGKPEFGHLPQGKPRIGFIVTGEPYYLGNSSWFRELIAEPPSFPTLVASLREIEHLAELELSDVEEQLTVIANDPEKSTWSLSTAIDKGLKVRDNTVLRRAWNSYPWPESPEGYGPSKFTDAHRR